MATMALNVVGAIAGVVGIGMMIPGLIPDKDKHEPIVRIAAGLTSNTEDTTSGNTPGVTLYDIMGRMIGSTEGKADIIKDGAFTDIKVPFNEGVGTKPAEYIAVTDGGNDALCIAYISLTNPDGGKHVWYGDIGKACGHPWYHSMLKTGKIGASEKEGYDYQPACVWIDRDRSNGLPYQGLGIHLYDFEATEERAKMYTDDKDQMCRVAPRYRMASTYPSFFGFLTWY